MGRRNSRRVIILVVDDHLSAYLHIYLSILSPDPVPVSTSFLFCFSLFRLPYSGLAKQSVWERAVELLDTESCICSSYDKPLHRYLLQCQVIRTSLVHRHYYTNNAAPTSIPFLNTIILGGRLLQLKSVCLLVLAFPQLYRSQYSVSSHFLTLGME